MIFMFQCSNTFYIELVFTYINFLQFFVNCQAFNTRASGLYLGDNLIPWFDINELID